MSTTVNYKGSTITTVNNETKTLNTAGTWVEGDITLVDNSTPNLQSKSVSYTPSESAQTATVTADSGYDGLGSVAVSVGAISGTYVGSQVPTQAAQTIHPSTSAQTIASGKYLTGDQTIEAVTTTNLTAANIKSGVVVKVGSATDDDSVLSLTGTAETGGATEIVETALKDVTFIDYEGTILHEYTKSEFLALTALPENPSHDGLIAQGWNWSLEDAQTYVSKWDCLVIGQNYTTSDGKTRIYINVTDTFIEHGQTFLLKFTCSVNGGAVIDWGDGDTTTSSGTALGTYSHTYTAAGEYVVTIDVAESATINLGYNGANNGFFYTNNGNWPARYLVNRIEIGDRVTRFNRYCFKGCINLKSISIPSGITEIGNGAANGYAFQNCGITGLVIPDGVTVAPAQTVNQCYNLRFISFPNGITSISSAPTSSASLPDLRALTFPDTPITFQSNISVSSDSFKLEMFSFPVVYNNTLSQSYLRGNYYCRKIIIPASVTQINDYAMTGTSGLREMYMLPETPPTIVNTRGLPYMSLTIYVPYSEDHSILEAYQTATNWSSYAARMVEMEE